MRIVVILLVTAVVALPAHAIDSAVKPWKLVKAGTGTGESASVSFDVFSIKRFRQLGVTLVTRPAQASDTRVRLQCDNASGVSATRRFTFEADIPTPKVLAFPLAKPVDCWIAVSADLYDVTDDEAPTGSITVKVWKRL